jgi:hypothetical protein
MQRLHRAERERGEAQEALRQVRHACLLNIRRAAFGPEIGVRYTEAIRAEIGNECWKLEQFIDRFLAAPAAPAAPEGEARAAFDQDAEGVLRDSRGRARPDVEPRDEPRG